MFKKVPILIQLIVMLLIIMVIPISITVYYSTVSLASYAEEEVADSVLAQLRANSELNERELFNIVRNTLAIAENSEIRGLKGINSYKQLNSAYETIQTGLKLLSQLQTLQDNNDMIESTLFIPEDGDYVISSRKSIVVKSEFGDLEWLEDALSQMKGVSGYWYPRNNGGVPVITYLYRLNRLTTSVKGIIAVNIYETEINTLLNFGNYKTNSDAFMIRDDGLILSHENKEYLFQDEQVPSYIMEIMSNNKSFDTLYVEEEGERILCAYYKPSNRSWVYGITYPMKDMLVSMESIQRNQIVLTIIIMAIGVIITVIYAKRFSRPMKQLANAMRGKNNQAGALTGNEITILMDAFRSIEEEEEQLYITLKEKEKDTRSRVLHNLLAGELEEQDARAYIKEIFPYKLFRVAIISIDNKQSYLRHEDSTTRSYQRYLLFEVIAKLFPKHYYIQSVRYDDGNIAIIMNMEGYDHQQSQKEMQGVFKQIQEAASDIFRHTVSVGISGIHTGYDTINSCTKEATEANEKKLFKGHSSIIFWENINRSKLKGRLYYYPYEEAERLMNYLGIGDLKGILGELDRIEESLQKRSDCVNTENVRMIFNQLAGNAMQYIMQQPIGSEALLEGKDDIYSELSHAENIMMFKAILQEWYKQIITYFNDYDETVVSESYSKQILDYLNQHYKEDVLYEDVAKEMGISYSYLRKIVKEATGKSVKDYVNKLRIDRVKTLLTTTDMTINQISEEVGYHNIQSITRYFKKFEGITPKEFKDSYAS